MGWSSFIIENGRPRKKDYRFGTYNNNKFNENITINSMKT